MNGRRALPRTRTLAPSNGRIMRIIEREVYSRLTIPTAGATSLVFFRDNFSPHTTNIKQPSKLIERGSAVLHGWGINIDPVGDDELSVADATSLTTGEAVRKYLGSGYIKLDINGVTHFEGLGINHWPSGGGTWAAGAIGGTPSGGAVLGGFIVNNGVPDTRNRRFLMQPIEIMPQDTVDYSITFPTAIAFPTSVTADIQVTMWLTHEMDAVRND